MYNDYIQTCGKIYIYMLILTKASRIHITFRLVVLTNGSAIKSLHSAIEKIDHATNCIMAMYIQLI